MLRFDNPGHRAKLHELGILAADQSNIAPADLAQRIVACPQHDEALYILQQEIRTQLTNFLLLDSQLEITREAAAAINDVASFDQAITRAETLTAHIVQIENAGRELLEFTDSFRAALPSLERQAQRNSAVEYQIEAIERFCHHMMDAIQTHMPAITAQLTDIARIIDTKRQQLGN